MKISRTIEIASDLSADELKHKLRNSYESIDTLKHAEFDPRYSQWSESMRTTIRSTHINNPDIHYLGRFYQGNFELSSPHYQYWRNVSVYLGYARTNSKLVLELKNFKITMIPLFMVWSTSLIISIFDTASALPFFVISSTVLALMLVKARNTFKYFKKYTS